MAVNPLEAQILLQLVPTITKIRYTALANTAIIVFDHLLTLDQEINLIWNADWSLGKVLFLVNRYYALVPVVFNNFAQVILRVICAGWVKWQGATGIFMFIVAELILMLRLYAMYFRDKRVLLMIGLVCAGAAGGSIYVMVRALMVIGAISIHLPLDNTTVCVPTGIPKDFYAFWIPMLISESFYCACAMYRGLRGYRRGQNVLQSGKQLINILVRDSLYYFFIIFATYLTNAVIFLTSPSAEVEIPIGFAQSLSCVMSSRLCLNVRGFIREQSESRGMLSSPPISPISASSRNAFVSFGEVGTASMGHTGSVVVGEGKALSEVELRELRTMRVPDAGRKFSKMYYPADMLDIK